MVELAEMDRSILAKLTTLEQVKALEAAGRLDSARAKTMIGIIQTALRVFDRNTNADAEAANP